MPRRLALWLTLPTGFAGLVYEVTWEQSLATLVGSHSEAAAAVLALFLGGLAAGYALFGRWARRLGDAGQVLRLYGGVEIAIGLHALLFPELLSAARAASARLPALADGPAFVADLALSALLLAPPAIAMGATIPLLTQALPRNPEESTRIHARVYSLNTLGAFFGALAGAFWILPTLGLSGTVRTLALVNLLAGGSYLLIARALPGGTGAGATPPAPREPVSAAAAALMLGFAMMTLQTTMLRLSALSLGGSPFTFAMVVAVFVLCIALGSAAVSGLRRVPGWLLPANLAALFCWLLFLYTPLQDGPYFGHRLRLAYGFDTASFYAYQASVLGALLLAIGPAALFSGASLPLLFDRLRRDRPDFGGIAGRLYAWNTLGSVGGALLGGYALFWWLDLHHVYRIACGVVGGALVLLLPGSLRLARPLLLVPLVIPLLLLSPWQPDRLASGAYRIRSFTPTSRGGPLAFFGSLQKKKVIFYDDDPSTSVSVKEFLTDTGKTDRSLVTNGKSDGAAVSEYQTMALASLVPALLAERIERGFVIGLGTGISSAALASLDGVREVVVAEISPAVIRTAPLFDPFTQGASHSDRIRMVRTDAYRELIRSEERFDVIVSEPSNPWVSGVEMLFSAEFLEQGRRHLNPGGVYVQWLQLYETDEETLALALRTLTSVFDHVSVWYGLPADLLLLGHQDGELALDAERLAERAARPDFAAALARAGIDDLPALLAHELLPLGTVHSLELSGPLHTLAHPRLRYAAARTFFTGSRARPPALLGPEPARLAEENSLLFRYLRARGAPLTGSERYSFALELCRHLRPACLAWLAQWTHDTPDSPELLRARRVIAAGSLTGERTRLEIVRPLTGLFDAKATLSPGAAGLKQATQATRLYAQYQHPTVRFSRAGMRARWQHCEAEPARREDCVRARRELEAEFGPLGVDP